MSIEGLILKKKFLNIQSLAKQMSFEFVSDGSRMDAGRLFHTRGLLMAKDPGHQVSFWSVGSPVRSIAMMI